MQDPSGAAPAEGTAATEGTATAAPSPTPDTPNNLRDNYRAKRRRQMLAKKRGPFIRDNASPDEFPTRARAVAYRMLNSEVSEETISAHHLIEFRKYVDSLLADATAADDVSEQLQEKTLDEVVRQHSPWWNLPRVEHWLSERVKAWAQPIKAETTAAAAPVPRFCQVSAYAAKGKRKSMEDYYCAYLHWGNLFGGGAASTSLPRAEQDERALGGDLQALQGEDREKAVKLWKNEHSARFLGVFDGHNGADCASYVCDLLPHAIVTSEHFPHDFEQACVSSFTSINASFIERGNLVECDAGTTALVAFMWGQRLYTAHVGDCAAIVAVKDKPPVELTSPHNPYNPAEAAAVEKRGGTISECGGKLRVDGVVSITRGFGCRPTTLHTSCIPDCRSYDVTPEDEFLLLASDGLWDVLTPQAAADFVREKRAALASPPADDAAADERNPACPYQDIAAQLAAHAIQLGSSDNVTALISFFNHDSE